MKINYCVYEGVGEKEGREKRAVETLIRTAVLI